MESVQPWHVRPRRQADATRPRALPRRHATVRTHPHPPFFLRLVGCSWRVFFSGGCRRPLVRRRLVGRGRRAWASGPCRRRRRRTPMNRSLGTTACTCSSGVTEEQFAPKRQTTRNIFTPVSFLFITYFLVSRSFVCWYYSLMYIFRTIRTFIYDLIRDSPSCDVPARRTE